MRGVSSSGQGNRAVQITHLWFTALRDAVLVTAACAGIALVQNALRKEGIPLIQREAYEILVPCTETSGEADPVTPEAVMRHHDRVFVVDARSAVEFEAWHPIGALNVPFDYLEQTSPSVIRRLASSGSREIIVYGDGGDPDSGEQLARELSGNGLRNVRFVKGGAPSILSASRKGAAP